MFRAVVSRSAVFLQTNRSLAGCVHTSTKNQDVADSNTPTHMYAEAYLGMSRQAQGDPSNPRQEDPDLIDPEIPETPMEGVDTKKAKVKSPK